MKMRRLGEGKEEGNVGEVFKELKENIKGKNGLIVKRIIEKLKKT
jgi:hypothetical protein